MALVTLLAHTPQPELHVAAAAKLCYSPSSIDKIKEGLTEEKVASFVDMLSEIGHESPIEHATFTFGIEGVSRALLAQITRHRIASFSAAIPEAKEEFIRAMEEDQRHYENLTNILTEKHKKALLAKGKDEKTAARMAQKQAIEDARFVLPNACDTKMIVTFNARSLMNFFTLRCCRRAQWEIQDVAIQMLRLVKQAAPHLFAKAGPNCVRGACSEGKMTCGEIKEVRAFFRNLGEKTV